MVYRDVPRFLNSCRPVFNVKVVITPKACIERLLVGYEGMLPREMFLTETSKTPFHSYITQTRKMFVKARYIP